MSRLDRLIEAERAAMVPSARTRAANLAVLQRAIADGRPAIVDAPPVGAPVLGRRGWVKPALVGALVLGLGALAGLLLATPTDEGAAVIAEAPIAAPDPEPPIAAPADVAIDAPARARDAVVVPPAAHDVAPTPPRVEPPRPTARKRAPAQDDLAAEFRLLRRAKLAHTEGKRERALAILREQARKFPRGGLVEERRGLEAIVACELDRTRGKPIAAAFQRDFAASPLTEHVRHACD